MKKKVYLLIDRGIFIFFSLTEFKHIFSVQLVQK